MPVIPTKVSALESTGQARSYCPPSQLCDLVPKPYAEAVATNV
jgi:hypothetical protein